MATIFFVSGFVQPGEHAASSEAIENTAQGNKWEYKSIVLSQGDDQTLNTQVGEFNWEFLGTTSTHALFRRAVPYDQ